MTTSAVIYVYSNRLVPELVLHALEVHEGTGARGMT